MHYFITLRTASELRFSEAHKAIVHRSITEVAERWKYEVHAIDVLDSGVYLLLSQGENAIKFVMTGMKAWSTRNLRENRTIGRNQTVWEKGGDIIYVDDVIEFERIRLLIEQEETARPFLER